MLKLTDRNWEKFKIGDIFDIKIGKSIDGNKVDLNSGKFPYITRKESNNGLDGFIDYDDSFLNKTYPVITIGNETAEPFVQTFPFFTGTKVNILAPKNNISYKCLLFIAQSLKMNKEKYSYSFTINSTRLKTQIVLLPIIKTSNDEPSEELNGSTDPAPDYEFMSDYIRERMDRQEAIYGEFIEKEYADILDAEISVMPLKAKKWKEFLLGDIFDIKNGQRLTKEDMIEGEIPFIGATDSNNGITNFTGNINESLDENVLGVNYDGSIVENFYHPYKCIFSDSVKRFSLKEKLSIFANKFVYLFLKAIILQQKEKYSYGYKFNQARMNRQVILLPVDDSDTLDFGYMENYGKKVFRELLARYQVSR